MVKPNHCFAAEAQRHQRFSEVVEYTWNGLDGFSLILFHICRSVSSFVYKSEEIPVLFHSAGMKVKYDAMRRV